MAKVKKRPSKVAKAAKKILKESELLTAKSERDLQSGQEFKSSVVTPRTSTAIKPRPDKKRG
ncbi:MAG: hypothetical protein ACT4O9_11565 [Blastocatellia bacterium]